MSRLVDLHTWTLAPLHTWALAHLHTCTLGLVHWCVWTILTFLSPETEQSLLVMSPGRACGVARDRGAAEGKTREG
jgi:hypothetical protein